MLKLHPKIAAQLRLLGIALAGQAILVLNGTETLTQAGFATLSAAVVILRGYMQSADPGLSAVADELLPLLEARIKAEIEAALAPTETLIVPEPGFSPATPPPAETVVA